MKQLQKTIFPLILALILVLSTGMTVLAYRGREHRRRWRRDGQRHQNRCLA